jgi:hypothetical protein
MKITTAFVSLFLTCIFAALHAANAGPIMSEIFYDPVGADDKLEWVELYNPDSVAVDLSTYSLGNGGTSYTYSKVQLAGTIAAYGYFLVGGPTSSSGNGNPVFNQAVDFNPDFQNGTNPGDGIALFNVAAASINASTVPIDAVIYGVNNASGLLDETGVAGGVDVAGAPSGSSIGRTSLAGGWQIQGSPSPGWGPMPIPEPATATLMLTGTLLLCARLRRKRKQDAGND